MKLRFQSITMILLGVICVSLIFWMLFSDAVTVQNNTANRSDFVINKTDTPIDIRKFETSYWSTLSAGDTLRPGDVIRATSSGTTFIHISDIAYVELTAPFEFNIVQNNSRQPIELSLVNGRLRYFYSFDDSKAPNAIITPVGRMVFSEVVTGDSKSREVVISHTMADTKIKVFSGQGNWFESGQTAVINAGEMLTRNAQNGELFKSTLLAAPSGLEVSSTPDTLHASWASGITPSGNIIRILQMHGDTLRHHATLFTQNTYIALPVPDTGSYLVQVAYDLPDYGTGNWDSGILLSID